MTIEELSNLGHADFNRDRWGRPLIEPKGGGKPKPYTRSSSAAKTVEDTFNLELWQRRNIAYGMAHDSSLIARVLAVGGTPSDWDQAQKKQINDICEQASDVAQAHKAADIGTALHAMVEQVNLGKPVNAGPYQPDLDAYTEAFRKMGWTVNPDHVECRMVCDELEMAGTCDMLICDVSGNHYVADLKTSASVDYGGLGWSAQLASYAHSELYSPLLNARLETPVINREIGYIVHLPAGQGVCTIHEVDLVKGYAAAQLANDIRRTRNEAKKYLRPVTTVEPEPVQPDTYQNLTERLRWLINAGHGETVVKLWPAGIAPLKQRNHSDAELAKITEFIQQMEARFEAPFQPAVALYQPVTEPVVVLRPVPEEGRMMDAETIAALGVEYGALSDDDKAIMRRVATEAHTTHGTISVSVLKSERRYLLTKTLIRWCEYGWDDDVVSAAIHTVSGHTGTIGECLSQFSIDNAIDLLEIVNDLHAGRMELAIGPDGITFEKEETS